ncbi:hypothetical protein HID58_089869 [Brassica napus]|uniref:NusG-like N-terminal domain-containing protein n=1 Tax=Brassica napus TaxID=3708 RepID=A0ABQ7Y0B0_BRANA|nr:hypothetical protein HID58_089869 [Brassica napus]
MDRKGKGKQIAGAGSSSGKKRKGGVEFRDEGLRISSKRKKPGVLQFFEESAEVGYYGGSSDEECDMDDLFNDMEDEPEVETSGKDDKGGKGKGSSSFVFPKEEEMNEDDYDRMMEERYKPGSGFVRYAADDVKSSIEMDALVPTAHDPPIWKIKCAIGREKHSVFCLMHKFVELRKIGTKLRILSVFFVEHVKGFIFIEADKEQDVLEACMSLNGIYATRMMLLPKSEAPHLLTVQRKTKTFSEGTWARIKSGKYKGDLAQVVAVSDTRGKALIKLIPRIDIAALTQKYGGGVAVQKGLNPAPRLISSSELEEFRPIIQVRRDRDTGMTFEHLDSLMLKDGFVYKKVSLDSLTSCGVKPSKEEILKFTPLEEKETGDVEWISEIYGEEKKKKKSIPAGKGVEKGEASGGGKGEGSSESQSESSHELYNLVCFSRKDFGLIVGVDDKGDGYKTGGFDASAFGDSTSSPKSPLSPEKEWQQQPKEKYINFKSEHLAEVRDRNTMPSTSVDAGMGSFQQFDMLGTTEGNNGDWAKGAGTSEDNTSTWGNTAAENKPDSAGDQSGGWNAWEVAVVEVVGISLGGEDPLDQAPWSKPGGGGGSSWGKQDNGGGGSSWGKDNDAGGGSSWSKQNNAGGGGGSSWSKDNDAGGGGGSSWGKQNNAGGGGGSSWIKDNDAGGGSSWGKQNNSGGGGSNWGQEKDAGGGSSWGKQGSDAGGSSWGKKNDAGGGGSSWGKQGSDGGGSSWGKKSDVGGGGSSFGQENNAGGGSSWGKQGSDGGGSSWGKKNDAGGGGGSSWGQQGGGGGSAWGKQNNDGGGGQSWSKQDDGGSKPWGEQSGGRGFGGRRGGGFRGGFRGGRNQSGRDGGGRSFESSGWKRDNQENTTWKSNNQSGGSDWKKGWGEDSNSAKPSDSSSAGGNWGSWDTSSKKETNAGGAWGSNSKKETIAGDGDKPSNENKAAAWGTANDQENAGNNNDGWGKKPSDDVKTSGEADNAWGGKTNAGASSSSGSAW